MPRIAFISDTHLSPRGGNQNSLRAIEAIATLNVDLVVNGGDISYDGADRLPDLAFAMEAHTRIKAPLAFIPGNHDIGEEPGALVMNQPIDAARRMRYCRVFGEDYWARDLGQWRIFGVNALLIGTNLAQEGEQGEWLMGELAQARGRPIGIFIHKPLWLEHPEEPGEPKWAIDPRRRAAMREAFRNAGVRFVASGHLHQYRARRFDDALHVWAPSAAFANPNDMGGDRRIGYAMLELNEDGGATASFAPT